MSPAIRLPERSATNAPSRPVFTDTKKGVHLHRLRWPAVPATCLFLLGMLLVLASPGAEASTSVGGTVSTDTTWTLTGSPYLVTSSIMVKGTDGADGITTLTIEPGVEVRFAQWTRLEVGGCCSMSEPGALVAEGTGSSPILFTSDQSAGSKTRGYWGTVQFNAYASDGASRIQNTTIEYGGASGAGLYVSGNHALGIFRDNIIQETNNQAVYLSNAALSIESSTLHRTGSNGIYSSSSTVGLFDSTISSAGGHGLYQVGGSATVERATLKLNGQYGLYSALGSTDVRDSLFDTNGQRPLRASATSPFETNTFVGNTINEVELLGGVLGQDQRLALLRDTTTGAALPYVITSGISVRGTDGADGVTSLTVDPGVTLRFARYAGLEVGYCCSASLPGALVASGTAAEPILFTSHQPSGSQTRGYWGPITFHQNAASSTILQNATVEYGGYHTASLHILSAGPSVRDVVVRESNNNAINLFGAKRSLRDVAIDGVQYRGLYVSSTSGKIHNITIEDVGSDGIYTIGGTPHFEDISILRASGYGVYTASGVPDFYNVSIQDVNMRPLRMHPDSRWSTIDLAGAAIKEIELLGGTVGRDQHYPVRVDSVTGERYAYVAIGGIAIRGTDGADGVTSLTVDPGVTLRFARYAGLEVGYCCSTSLPGALVARGTAAEPILFTSHQPSGSQTRGYWGPITFHQNAASSTVLQNATVEYGGYHTASLHITSAGPSVRDVVVREGNSNGINLFGAKRSLRDVAIDGVQNRGLYVSSTSGKIHNITIEDVGSDGIYTIGGTPHFEDISILRASGYGVYAASGVPDFYDISIQDVNLRPLRMHPDSRWSTIDLAGAAIKEIELLGGTVGRDQHYPVRVDSVTGERHAYVAIGGIAIRGMDGADGVTTLTLDPGVTLRFARYAGLEVGYCCSTSLPGALVASGTAAEPILFTSHQPSGSQTRGYWGPITFHQNTASSTVLQNATVEYGGYHTAALNLVRSTGVGHLLVRESGTHGIQLSSTAHTIRNITVTGVSGTGIHLASGDLVLLDADITGAGGHGVYLWGASPLLERVAVNGTGHYGVYTASGVPDLVDSTIDNTAGKPLRVHIGSRFQDTRISGAGTPEVELLGGTLSRDQTLPVLSDEADGTRFTYAFLSSTYVRGTDGPDAVTTLTVEPGVTLRMPRYANLEVGYCCSSTLPGSLIAKGTEAERILVTSDQPVGSETARHWGRILFDASATASALENVTVAYGGYGDIGAIHLNRAAVDLRNNEVRSTGAIGIRVYQVSGTTIEGNRVGDIATGLYLQGGGDLLITGNSVNATGYTARLLSHSGSILHGNTFTSASGILALDPWSKNNRIHDNILHREDGGGPARDDGSANIWYTEPILKTNIIGGPYQAGNVYANYRGNDTSNPSDGIGDTDVPHPITGTAGAIDPYPLVPSGRWTPDTELPVTTLILAGTAGASGWWTSTVNVSLEATDTGSGVERIVYDLDGAGERDYTDPFDVTDGLHRLVFHAEDKAGNVESPQNATIPVDTTPPDLAVVPEDPIETDLCFTLTATDTTSGIAALTWSVTNATGAIVTNSTGVHLEDVAAQPDERICAGLDQDGTYIIVARTRDQAGHGSVAETDPLDLDLAGPIIDLQRPQHGGVYSGTTSIEGGQGKAPYAIVIDQTEVVAEASDLGTGVSHGELWIDGTLMANTTGSSFVWTIGPDLAPGQHHLVVRVYDHAGHLSTVERDLLLTRSGV